MPNLRNTDSVTLILLEGVHNSTITLNFVQIRHVVMTSQNSAEVWADLDNQRTLIQMLSSNISVIDVSFLEIKNLAIDGSGQSVLLVQKNSGSWSISFNQIAMFRMILQVQPLSTDALSVFTIASSLFKMSRIEIRLCVYAEFEMNDTQNMLQSVVHIKSTRFLAKRSTQLNSIVVFSPDGYESQSLSFDLDNVTVSDLSDSVPLNSFPPSYFCDGIPQLQSLSDIYVHSSDVKMAITNSHFLGNIGTAIHAKNSITNITNCTFSGYSEGALIFDDRTDLKLFMGSTAIFNNSIEAERLVPSAAGLMISSGQAHLVNCYFYDNNDLNGNSQIMKLDNAYQMNIHDSTFMNNNGTVINAEETTLSFSGVVTFIGNSAHQGGALSISSVLKIKITLADYTTIKFIRNSASQFGGAIYIDSSPSIILAESNENNNLRCFYGPLPDSSSQFKHIMLNFRNNSAGKGGDHIYGISVKNYCKIKLQNLIIDEPWKHIFHIEPNATFSPVASSVLRACICDENGQPQCANESKIFSIGRAVYPGETFSISAVTVGAEFGTTVGEVYAKLLPGSSNIHSSASLGDSQQHIQRITNNDHCTPLNYSLYSQNSDEIIYLTVADRMLNTYGDVNGILSAIEEYKQTDVIPRSLLITSMSNRIHSCGYVPSL